MFYLAGIIITFFLTLILLTKKGKTAADIVLAAWLAVIGIHLLLFYLQITGDTYRYPFLLGIAIPMPLLHGPFLYVYTRVATRESGFKTNYWLHLLPALVAYLCMANFFRLSAAEKINVYQHRGAGYEVQAGAILIAAIISGFVYVLLSFYELRKYKHRIDQEFSNTESINLNWLRYLAGGILVIWIIILFTRDDNFIFGAVVIFVLALGYFGIKHVGVFTYRHTIVRESPATSINQDSVIEPTTRQDETKSASSSLSQQEDKKVDKKSITPVQVKYEKSGLQKELAEKIHSRLILLMNREKMFRQEELSLAQLAQRLDVHPNNLSQVINSYEGKSFYDYINTLRIEEFKRLAVLPENSKYTLLSLAFECGFNSKTSFNRNFKKIEGRSPSTYLKEVNVKLTGE